jgi:hypothetical protein
MRQGREKLHARRFQVRGRFAALGSALERCQEGGCKRLGARHKVALKRFQKKRAHGHWIGLGSLDVLEAVIDEGLRPERVPPAGLLGHGTKQQRPTKDSSRVLELAESVHVHGKEFGREDRRLRHELDVLEQQGPYV